MKTKDHYQHHEIVTKVKAQGAMRMRVALDGEGNIMDC